MHDLNDLVIFARVVQTGSLTAAADVLGIPKSNVSRRLSRLEGEMGVRLLERTTRKLHLTEVGGLYYEHCRRILEEVEHAELSVQQRLEAPRGLLRISASYSTGQALLSPLLGEFMALYPEVTLQLVLTNRRVDLIEEGFDMTIRMGQLEESALVARYLGSTRGDCVASPAYIKRMGMPAAPEDLTAHQCLTMTDVPQHERWTFTGADGEVRTVNFKAQATVNDFVTLRGMLVSGAGIGVLPNYFCAEAVGSGQLVPVLAGWTTPVSAMHALYPSHRGATPKLRALLDFLVTRLEDKINTAPCGIVPSKRKKG
jgi:LysR family transcriptional regulator AphB